MLHKYGIENPTTGLAEKTVGYQFAQKVDVRDPHTMKKDKKHLKPFMVNNSVLVFERHKIVLSPDDKVLIEQLNAYCIKSVSTTGLPVYTDENEHAVDALNLCLLIFEQKYGTLFKGIVTSKVMYLNDFRRNEAVVDRNIQLEAKSSSILALSSDNNYSRSNIGYNRVSRTVGGDYFKRKGF